MEFNKNIFPLLKEKATFEHLFHGKHTVTPYIPKFHWNELGDHISQQEKDNSNVAPGKWMSLRIDGNGFSKKTKKYKHEGLFTEAFSQEMVTLMRLCVQKLMTRYSGKYGFTQSDEMTILIPPNGLDRKGSFNLTNSTVESKRYVHSQPRLFLTPLTII